MSSITVFIWRRSLHQSSTIAQPSRVRRRLRRASARRAAGEACHCPALTLDADLDVDLGEIEHGDPLRAVEDRYLVLELDAVGGQCLVGHTLEPAPRQPLVATLGECSAEQSRARNAGAAPAVGCRLQPGRRHRAPESVVDRSAESFGVVQRSGVHEGRRQRRGADPVQHHQVVVGEAAAAPQAHVLGEPRLVAEASDCEHLLEVLEAVDLVQPQGGAGSDSRSSRRQRHGHQRLAPVVGHAAEPEHAGGEIVEFVASDPDSLQSWIDARHTELTRCGQPVLRCEELGDRPRCGPRATWQCGDAHISGVGADRPSPESGPD